MRRTTGTPAQGVQTLFRADVPMRVPFPAHRTIAAADGVDFGDMAIFLKSQRETASSASTMRRRACSSRIFEVSLPTTITIARWPLRLPVRMIEEPQ